MKKRVEILDLLRSLAIVMMVVFHLLYDLYIFDFLPYSAIRGTGGNILSSSSAAIFLIVAGASSIFSKSNLRRGFKIFLIALILTVITTLVGLPIKFGILHLMGICMIAYGLFGDRSLPSNPLIPIICTVLFFIFKYLSENIRVESDFLFPFGFYSVHFYSSDYYPILPWAFLFIIGIWLGGKIRERREHPTFNLSLPPALTFLGRHSLVIYLAHQPILFGIVFLLSKL